MVIDAQISKNPNFQKGEYNGKMVVVQEGNIRFFKIKIQNLHFTQMFTILTTMGTPSMIAFKMKVVNMNLKYE